MSHWAYAKETVVIRYGMDTKVYHMYQHELDGFIERCVDLGVFPAIKVGYDLWNWYDFKWVPLPHITDDVFRTCGYRLIENSIY
jgi:hypothetical protein